MKDYKHIEHMRNLNDSLIWERMKRCYDYGYEDGLGKAQTDSYVKGYEDGQKEKLANAMIHDHEVAEKAAYEQGLNDVWEVIKKITDDERDGGYPIKMLNELFGSIIVYDIVHDYTLKEVLAKIKEYEEKQKCKECKRTKDPIFYGHCVGECDYAKQTEDEIKVGYEVYNIDRENKRIVTAIDGNKAIQLCSNGKYTIDNIDTLHWTGREDLRIKTVLEKITNEV